ncbi:MAG: hypothetical protein ACPGSM_06850, partial [Thiolinea sp.]
TDFIGIVPADQGEWLNGMPGAFADGSVSSGKMGITVRNPAAGQLYKAIFYRNNAKVGSSQPFSIN